MSVYSISLFLHIVGAIGLFAGISLELAGLAGLQRATTTAQLREWLRLLGVLQRIVGPATGLIILTGLHLARTSWGRNAWIALGLLGILAMAGLGRGLTRSRLRAIAQAVPSGGDHPIPAAIRQRLGDPVLRASIALRLALGLGIVFLMSVKPGTVGALVTVFVALLVGTVVGWGGKRRQPAVRYETEP